MNTNFRSIQSAALADWGPTIETAARRIAVLVAFTYAAGFTLGAWIHQANDRLAAAYVALLGLSEPKPVDATPEPVAQPTADPEPIAWAVCYGLRSELPAAVAPPAICSLTVAELRKLARAQGIKQAGGRRIAQATKSALLEILS
jgi:hypothetical protein